MGAQQPFLYQSERFSDMYDGFPSTPFDPKAVTRASFQTQRPRPKPNGPLVSFNRHPDCHEAPKQRSFYWKPMSGTTQWWIKATRVVQLCLRVLELIAAAAVFVVFILMTNTGDLVAWVMRFTTAVVMIHCVYGIWHLSRPAGRRTAGSSGAYHTFAGITDLVVLPLYAYGALAIRNNSAEWTTLLTNPQPLEYFRPGAYYTLIGSGGAHVLSVAISLWLALMFRRIHRMPPDMNPLEANLTARASHKRNKSSMATTSTYADSLEKRYSGTTLEEHRPSGQPYEDLSHPPTVPFMHTRQGSETSLRSSLKSRDSRVDLPQRQYQIVPSNTSPRHSGASELSLASKRQSGGLHSPTKLTSHRNSYTEVPLHDTDLGPSSRPTTGTGTRPSTNSTYRTSYTSQTSAPTPPRHSTPTGAASREPRFTEAWYASESLVSRTQAHLNRTTALAQLTSASASSPSAKSNPTKAYAPLQQTYNDDSDSENDLSTTRPQPHPLRSNPSSPPLSGSGSCSPATRTTTTTTTISPTRRPKTPFANPPGIPNLHRNSPLSEISLNLSGTDISTERLGGGVVVDRVAAERKSSIQGEEGFSYSKPYGQLGTGAEPVMLTPGGGGGGGGETGVGRQVSSGNDYQSARFGARWSVFGRRNVSGKVAEEGRGRWTRD